MEVLARLWIKMAAFYGKLFINRYGEADDTGMWNEALNDLSEREIEYGFSLIVKGKTDGEYDKFPPNPAQFRKLCLTNTGKSIPGVGSAFNEAATNASALMNQWSHPFIKVAAEKVGMDKLDKLPVHISYPLFVTEFERVCKQARLTHIPTRTIRIDRAEKQVDSYAATKHLAPLLRSLK